MDPTASAPKRLECPGERRTIGLRVVCVLYGALSIYLLTQSAQPVQTIGPYPVALSLVTATNSFALLGSVLGLLVTVPACMQRTLASLSVLAFTLAFFLGLAALFAILFTFFSLYWALFSGLHIFAAMVSVGAAYAHFRGIASQQQLEETLPIAASLPKVTEAV
ncbi:hypothetical protein, conserved [Eimeria brunetti]|uniref:Uncharacterized protein n=1 Tax=Eimeria brunetti TaxID=51314 RepID=U6L9I3_9EIME|nr:hypothetical protein, conserved [Eimeria brunetti]